MDALPGGRAWFWANVLQTAARYLWRDASGAPLRMLWLAISGLLETLVAGGVLGWLMLGALGLLAPHWMASLTAGAAIPWQVEALRVLTGLLVAFLVGRDVARRSDGREMASAASYLLFLTAISALSLLLPAHPRLGGVAIPRSSGALSGLVRFCGIAAGAVACRRSLALYGRPEGVASNRSVLWTFTCGLLIVSLLAILFLVSR
jgi:hypothetical protein